MGEQNFILFESHGAPIKAWVRDVPVEPAAIQQLRNVASLPFIFKWVAAMPDVHFGIGATVGSVIPTRGAIMPAAVGRGDRRNAGGLQADWRRDGGAEGSGGNRTHAPPGDLRQGLTRGPVVAGLHFRSERRSRPLLRKGPT